MLGKTLLFCFLPVCLVSCSGAGYYFHKRIDRSHPVSEALTKEDLGETRPMPLAPSAHDPAAAGTDLPVATVEVHPTPVVREDKIPVLIDTRDPDSTKRNRVVENEAGEFVVVQDPEPQPEPEAGMDHGWKIFWIVFSITSALIFCIALALGLTVGQALLAIPLTYLFIIIILVDLL